MKLVLRRTFNDPKFCTGVLEVDGLYFCRTLEDTVRLDDPSTPKNEGAKVYGLSAIAAGVYRIIINMSNRFKKRMPLLLDVPGFTGIRIHSGNTEEDTLGCILVGMRLDLNGRIAPGTSRLAFGNLMAMMEAAVARGESITIDISNEFCDD